MFYFFSVHENNISSKERNRVLSKNEIHNHPNPNSDKNEPTSQHLENDHTQTEYAEEEVIVSKISVEDFENDMSPNLRPNPENENTHQESFRNVESYLKDEFRNHNSHLNRNDKARDNSETTNENNSERIFNSNSHEQTIDNMKSNDEEDYDKEQRIEELIEEGKLNR